MLKETFKETMKRVKPGHQGKTPMAYSLRKAVVDISTPNDMQRFLDSGEFAGGEKSIMLITDGEGGCDSIEEVRGLEDDLRLLGVDIVRINVITLKIPQKEKSDQMAGSLTLVDQKRIELSRALATQPRVLLLDEVMAGLNPTETEDAVKLIRKVHQRGLTLIVVEHVMEVIMNLSERIVVLDSGELIADGPPEEIAHNQRVIEAYLGEEYHA